jgi:hypothetical protein
MIFGVVQILLGCLCELAGAGMALVTMVGPMGKTPGSEAMIAWMMFPAIIFYFLLGVALIWVGIGSIRARRWAWTLTVVLSWMWLILGAVSFIGFVFLAGPMMAASMQQQGQPKMPPEAMMVMRIIMGGFMFCIYILLPAVFLVFYHRASVWAFCQRRDPQVRWTDRCPMPVLALSLLLAFSVVSMLSMPAYGCVMPLFGHYVSGAVGGVVMVLIALILAYLAWGTYRLRMAAWWGTLLLWIVGTANAAIMFLRTDLIEMYEKMGMPETQLEMIRKSGLTEVASRWGPWALLVTGVLWLGYLLYIRRYFTGNVDRAAAVSREE